LQFYSGGNTTNYNVFNLGTINLNTWHHVAMQRISGTVRIYIDGVIVGVDYTGSNANLLTPFLTGAYYTLNSGRFLGYFSNTRVFNSAIFATGGFTSPTTEADYSSATNRLLFIRGITDFNNSLALTNVNSLLVYRPITATNPQTQSNSADYWQNNSETLTEQYLAPELIREDTASYWFTAGVANLKTYAGFIANVANKITTNINTSLRRVIDAIIFD
jgi:hypothetical protein